ncbi:MAG: hypothetical protein O9341_02095 [Paucibacter sp.]|nr:hypothetical protein [Roseateles sp.]
MTKYFSGKQVLLAPVWAPILALALLAGSPDAAAAEPGADLENNLLVRDQLKVHTSSLVHQHLLELCLQQQQPGSAPALRQAWSRWREQQELDRIDAALKQGPAARYLPAIAQMAASQRPTLQAQLQSGQSCAGFPQLLQSPSADLRKLHPAAYPSAKEVAEQARQERLAQLRTAPGQGIQPSDIVTVLQHGYNMTLAGGSMAWVTETRVLLKDGWVYQLDELPPSDLNVQASRRLEADRWQRWRAKGKEFEMQEAPSAGKAAGEWQDLPGFAVPGWAKGRKLDLVVSKSSFHGSLFLGGSYFKTSFIFKPDGRFETLGYSQSGSGMMAATTQGFSAQASSYSSGKGSSSIASGGNAAVVAQSERSRDDGAEHCGSYHFEGYTLELRYDNGRVARVISYPWNEKLKNLFIDGDTYSQPEPEKAR